MTTPAIDTSVLMTRALLTDDMDTFRRLSAGRRASVSPRQGFRPKRRGIAEAGRAGNAPAHSPLRPLRRFSPLHPRYSCQVTRVLTGYGLPHSRRTGPPPVVAQLVLTPAERQLFWTNQRMEVVLPRVRHF
jgi:hypothetical protein